jgi:hypothetical protein
MYVGEHNFPLRPSFIAVVMHCIKLKAPIKSQKSERERRGEGEIHPTSCLCGLYLFLFSLSLSLSPPPDRPPLTEGLSFFFTTPLIRKPFSFDLAEKVSEREMDRF